MARIPDPVSKTRDPAIVVDLEWRDGLICFVVRNLSASSVQDVSIAFRRGIMRLGGQVDITALPIWDNLTFAPPAKRIEVPIDRDETVFANNKPSPIAVPISYKDADGTMWRAVIRLGLAACQTFPELKVR